MPLLRPPPRLPAEVLLTKEGPQFGFWSFSQCNSCNLCNPFNLFNPFRFACFALFLGLMFMGCTSKEEKSILQPTESLAPILVEETVNAAGANRKVAIISPDSKWGPTSAIEQSFRSALKKQGFTIIDAKCASLGDPMRSGEVGLTSSDFIEVLEKFPDVGAIVSFAGAPLLKPPDFPKASAQHPPVLVVATAMLGTTRGVPGDRNQFPRLLDSKAVQLIIIDGADPTPSTSTKRDSTHDLFAQHFRILRAN
jgi:hypothetical protein